MKISKNTLDSQVNAFLKNGGSITFIPSQEIPGWAKNQARGKGDSIAQAGRKNMYHNVSKGMKGNAQA